MQSKISIIIIDDDSTDNSLDIVDDVGKSQDCVEIESTIGREHG